MKGNIGRRANIEQAAAREPTKDRSLALPEADYGVEHTDALILVACRRLLTQLEAAKGSRGGAPGDGKLAPAKGPDGVVLYELHSRPEQEKFTESAKVCSSCHVFSSHERNV